MNKNLMRSFMTLNNDTYATLAESIGISAQSFSDKMNERGTEFKQGEIAKIKDRYNLTAEQVESIFFA